MLASNTDTDINTFDSPFYTPSLFQTNTLFHNSTSSPKHDLLFSPSDRHQDYYQHTMDTMSQQLREANQLIQKLAKQLSVMNMEMEKKSVQIIHLQSTLALKEKQLKATESSDLVDLDTMSITHSETILGNTRHRRLLDKSKMIDWDSLVDRITRDTDQQASLFMQQKLKSASQVQKQQIYQAILHQAYALMTNRFGNFLVQRLFELGTPEQIETLADKMRGHIVELTCEPFGCHVVQKALDYIQEESKADFCSELFFCVPQTITHKYACHVWQKVFELRWVHIPPPPVMKYVHAALQGQWAQVALDETGSLVIQNVFENLLEPDKRPVLDEVLQNTLLIAKGQWGNWVIQHILEQAENRSDREAAFDIVIREAVQLSMDQFASKVVEKALRMGGQSFLTKFIQRISDTTHRPRMALIDIASDQYGNYVVQWLINNASEEQKLFICRSIKRHMVSLRGSKYGQRVAFLVEKVLRHQEITTYPA